MEGTDNLEPKFPLLKSKVKARKMSSRTRLLLTELGDALLFFSSYSFPFAISSEITHYSTRVLNMDFYDRS